MAGLRLDLGPLKEPLGLVRGLQWIFSICAFAPCGGFGGSVSFLVSCAGEPNRTVTAAFEYPFRLNRAAFAPSLRGLCNGSVWTSDVHLVGDFSSGAQFFVAVAVLAFLYSLAALGLYVAFLPLYRGGRRLPMADLVATAVFSFLWLVATSAWAKALADVKASTGAPLPGCRPPALACRPAGAAPMGALNGSVAFGFLNLLLWLGSSWFVYKETHLHRPPPAPAPAPM